MRNGNQMWRATFLTVVLGANAGAQWSGNPTVNNAIGTASQDQTTLVMVSDGSGGAIIAWADYRTGSSNTSIYAQRIAASGAVQWTSNGVVICTAALNQVDPAITTDGSGGAIIAWRDARNSIFNNDIYAQRINANGDTLWKANGVVVTAAGDHQSAPVIASDGSGGAIIAWLDQRNGGIEVDLYAQRVNSAGSVQWTADGVAISTAGFDQFVNGIVSDGRGGAIMVWMDTRDSNADIYAQRVNSTGAAQWTANGAIVYSGVASQESPAIVSDDSAGAIISWTDNFNAGNVNLYAQRMDSNGTKKWSSSGVAICTATDNQEPARITSDGSGGAIMTWMDLRSGTEYDVYAQRIAYNGVVQWTGNGEVVSNSTGNQMTPVLTTDGGGGAIIAWIDGRSGGDDVYAQRLSSGGAAQWTSGGLAVCTATGSQSAVRIISGSTGDAIMVWEDNRGGSTADLYAARMSSDGVLPVQLSSFSAVVDGASVTLRWRTMTETDNAGWEVERRTISDRGLGIADFQKVGFVEGAGTSSSAREYWFKDAIPHSTFRNPQSRIAYRLKQIDRNGAFRYTAESEIESGLTPGSFALNQNVPNPFNPSTTISFVVPEDGMVLLRIYDVLGREVATLVDGDLKAGILHEAVFDGSKLASGMFFARLESAGRTLVRSMLMLK